MSDSADGEFLRGVFNFFLVLKALPAAVFMEKRGIELEPPHGLIAAARGAGIRHG